MARLTFDLFEEAAKRFEESETEMLSSWNSGCQCSTPGEKLQCWNCPYYKGFGRLIQRKLHSDPDQVFAEIPPPEYEDPYSSAVKQECCKMYGYAYSIQDIQSLVGVPSRRVLRNWLREVGLPGRSAHYPEELKQKCLAMYADRISPRQIEEETGVSADTIADWALHEKISRSRKYSDEKVKECLDLYQTGFSSEDIHRMTGIPTNTLRLWIHKAKLTRKQKRYSFEERLKCRRLYENGETPPQIEILTGIKQSTIRSWIRKEQWKKQQNRDCLLSENKEISETNQLSSKRKPMGYWKDFDTLRNEILLLNQNRGKLGSMPTADELKELGRGDLLKAITKYHGGFQAVAECLGLTYRKKKGGYWHDFDNVKRELFSFIRDYGTSGVMPTKSEIECFSKGTLCSAVDLHGGFPAVAHRLNLKLSYVRKPRGYWKNLDNLKSEISAVSEELNMSGVLPTHEDLKKMGRTDLISAIASNGGWPSVSRKIGFIYQKQYNDPSDYF